MKTKYKWIIGILVLLLGIRIALPYVMKNQIVKKINAIDGYYGSLDDIDLHLYRGGFKLHNLKIFEEASEKPEVPLVDLVKLDFSIEWRALFKGAFVGEAYLDKLNINFTKREPEAEIDSTNGRFNLVTELEKLNPIQLNIVEVTNAEISYVDPTASPKINESFHQFYLRGENLGNVNDGEKELPASLEIRTESADSGHVYVNVQMNVLKDPPDFNYDLEVENIDLSRYNEIFEELANFEIEHGSFNLYSEGRARDGYVEAYAKPLVLNLEIAESDSTDGLLKKIYTGVVDFGAGVLENSDEQQTGTKVPIEGSFVNADPAILQSIINFFKNAFLEAYVREIENTITYNASQEKK